MINVTNPIINSDFPDPDIIRVGDTYYMASTTMYFMPGCDILRSYDLVHWELYAQAYDALDTTPRHMMEGEQSIYGEGMWAPTFRYHKGKYYIVFTANDTHRAYLFTADHPAGPWTKSTMEGWFYDSGLFFDDDDKVYIVHGQKTLHLTQLKEDLSGPLPGGLDRIVAVDEPDANLGFEGSHMYKRDGQYYIFTCHFLKDEKKTEYCFISDSLTGEFEGKCVLDDDMGYHGLGVAQGGFVDTPDGTWYAFMFQDRGAMGRAPVLIPMSFDGIWPSIGVNGKVPKSFEIPEISIEHEYEPLNGSDDFSYTIEDGNVRLKRYWQFNHQPVNSLWSVTEREGHFRLHSGKISPTIFQAWNTLTQRTFGPISSADVIVDASELRDGDYAGIAAFISNYGFIAVTKENGQYYLVMMGRPAKNDTVFGDFDYLVAGTEYERIEISNPIVRLKVVTDFRDKVDQAFFAYEFDGTWYTLGIHQQMYFKLDLFTGCRFGLFYYSTKETGGVADFSEFHYCIENQE